MSNLTISQQAPQGQSLVQQSVSLKDYTTNRYHGIDCLDRNYDILSRDYHVFEGELVHYIPEQEAQAGGILLFSVHATAIGTNAERICDLTLQFLSQHQTVISAPVQSFTIGRFLKPQIIGQYQEEYNSNSIGLEIKGLHSAALNQLADYLLKALPAKSLLVRDYTAPYIYEKTVD